jgi:general secretion pathway protein I
MAKISSFISRCLPRSHDSTTKKKSLGFTLIEVLVALVLLALSMGSVIASIGSNSFQLEYMRDRFHANRVAMHVAGEYYLLNPWPKLGTRAGDVKVGKSLWEWEAKVSDTSELKMRRIDITIYSDINPEQGLAKHTFFATNPSLNK